MREDHRVITTPGGPYPVADRDGLLRCFDDTAAGVFARISRLIGGERGIAEPLYTVELLDGTGTVVKVLTP